MSDLDELLADSDRQIGRIVAVGQQRRVRRRRLRASGLAGVAAIAVGAASYGVYAGVHGSSGSGRQAPSADCAASITVGPITVGPITYTDGGVLAPGERVLGRQIATVSGPYAAAAAPKECPDVSGLAAGRAIGDAPTGSKVYAVRGYRVAVRVATVSGGRVELWKAISDGR